MFLDKETLLKIWLKGEVTRDDCNEDFKRNTALQHCCDIVSNGHNIVPALQRCAALKIVVVNRPVYYHFNLGLNSDWVKLNKLSRNRAQARNYSKSWLRPWLLPLVEPLIV